MKNYLRYVFSLAVLSIIVSGAFAVPRGGQYLVPPGHWVYDALTAVELESGTAQFSDRAPLSVNEIRAMLTEIDYDVLTDTGKIQYDRILDYFNENNWSMNASIVSAGVEPSVNPEAFLKTEESAPWIFDRYQRCGFLEIPVYLGVGDYAALYTDIMASQNKTAMGKHENYVNVPYNGDNFDINFPHHAYLSIGTKFTDTVGVNFRLGNMPHAFGRASTGSVMISEYMTDTTSAELMVYSSRIMYSASVTELNSKRYLYMHKLDLRPVKCFTIGLMEACLPYGGMDLKFMNPFAIYHGYAAWKDYQGWGSDVGSYFGAKFNFIPAKYLRIYGLFAMTQFQTAFELSDDESDPANFVPNGMGWQLGLESYVPVPAGQLHFNLEGYYGQPYLYINDSPNWSYVKTYKENFNGSDTFYEWVGAKYGPDTVAAQFDAEYEVPRKWSAGLKYVFLARGELSEPDIFRKAGWGGNGFDCRLKDWVYPNSFDGKMYNKDGRDRIAPSGLPEYVNAVSLRGTYMPSDWVTLIFQPSFAFILNSGHEDGKTAASFEAALGARIALTKIRKN